MGSAIVRLIRNATSAPITQEVAVHIFASRDLLARENWPGALGRLDLAIRLCPNSAEAWCEKAYVLHELANKPLEANLRDKRLEEALKCADTAINLESWDPASWKIKAKVLLEMNRLDEACQAIDQALFLQPSDEESLRLKSSILRGLHRENESAIFRDMASVQAADSLKEKGTCQCCGGPLD